MVSRHFLAFLATINAATKTNPDSTMAPLLSARNIKARFCADGGSMGSKSPASGRAAASVLTGSSTTPFIVKVSNRFSSRSQCPVLRGFNPKGGCSPWHVQTRGYGWSWEAQ
eukprot:Protomagalhaensia_sp_Gyna_25__5023@NODE_559_length_3124_cov_119_624311_g434_i0_p4_GENE_NODE_559_length_3124_cov_119_624311_g434_i0NODE_559_length_3124_cov_119_624311_g434_i0_p4_ORF_typecomplete_len112_score7_51_NODE_559_length_3124_cov_119_624311_g434_i0490825